MKSKCFLFLLIVKTFSVYVFSTSKAKLEQLNFWCWEVAIQQHFLGTLLLEVLVVLPEIVVIRKKWSLTLLFWTAELLEIQVISFLLQVDFRKCLIPEWYVSFGCFNNKIFWAFNYLAWLYVETTLRRYLPWYLPIMHWSEWWYLDRWCIRQLGFYRFHQTNFFQT